MRFSRSEPGVIVSIAAHIGLFIAAMTLFATTDKFEDAAEMIPIDVVSDSELNSVVKGERTAKEVKPGPRVDKLADKPDTPPEPPLNQAEKDKPAPPQQAQKLPEPSSSSEAQKLSSPPTPEKQPEAKAPEPKQSPAARDKTANEDEKSEIEEAEVIKPKPPKRPKFETETKDIATPKPSPRLKADELAKLLENKKKLEDADQAEKEPKPKSGEENTLASKFSASSIMNLLTREAAQRRAATGQELKTASLGAPEGAADKLSATMESRIAAYIHDHYHPCWASALSLGGATFAPVVEFHLSREGALEGRPQLMNPSNNPVEQARGEQALQAVRRCSPMKIPDEFKPFYDQTLRDITIRFQDSH